MEFENKSLEKKNEIDKLTLELLINKSQYNKYLSKHDPKKYKEQQEFLDKVLHYKSKIMSLTNDFIESPKLQMNNELNEMFYQYMRTCIHYLEMKEMDVKTEEKYQDELHDEYHNEEDVLFSNIIEDNNTNTNEPEEKKSFWSKEKVKKIQGHKMSKSAHFDMKMFSNY